MDPLWSEACLSTFKYFIILIVSTYYILCISWTIMCLIIIVALCEHEDSQIVIRIYISSGILRCVFMSVFPDVSADRSVFIFRVKEQYSRTTLSWRWRQYDLSKVFIYRHSLISQMNWFFINSTVCIPDPSRVCLLGHMSLVYLSTRPSPDADEYNPRPRRIYV